LSAAEGTGKGAHYEESIKGASVVAPSKATPTQNGAKSLYDDWQNIFGNNSSAGSTQKRDFNDTNAWLSSAYLEGNKTRLIVGLSNNRPASLSEVTQIAARHQGKIVDTVSFKNVAGAAVVELPITSVTSFVGEIGEAKLASYVEPNMKMQTQWVPNDPSWSLQWGPQKVEADWAWNTTTGDSSVLVAVVDTGIDYSHAELTANYVPLGFDWVNNDNDPIDDCGHGTHCAGIIAAAINNGIGIAGLAQVRIMAEKVLDYSGWGYDDWVANGIIHAVDQGARIISMSLGGSGDSQLIHDAVKYAYSAGVLVIAAAGNDNTNMKSYPAAYDEVVAVAATDQNDFKAGFSNWGDWIELAAPGVNIYSTLPTYQVYLNNLGYSMYYDYLSGTSMACPHVAGVAALVWSHHPAKSSVWIRQWLHYTADDLGDPGFDQYYGYGRIDARNAVEQAPPTHELIMSSWVTPPYVEPGTTGLVNATVLNFGESDETDVTVELLANDSVISDTLIDFVPSGGLAVASLTWSPTVEGSYNVSAYVIPVVGETSIANNALSKNISVGTPVKAVVLRSYGNVESNSITSWQALNNQWQLFGDTMVYVDYETLNKENITYDDIVATGADVLIISCACYSYSGWEFADSEINAITRYIHEGHGLIATAGTFYYDVPNNNKLMPLFGMNQYQSYYSTGTDLLHLLNPTHPFFTDVPNPLVFPNVATAIPTSGLWDSRELTDGKYLAMGHFNESAIVTYRGLVYISPWFEIIPPYYHHPLKLLYNAILWSRYQKPQHELEVSLGAPTNLQPGDSTLLNATVSNMGLNTETNVELDLMIDDSTVNSTIIPELPVSSSSTIQYLWSPTIEKTYNITAYAPPMPSEESTSNNIITVFVSVRPISRILFDQTRTMYFGYFSKWVENLTGRGDVVDTQTYGPITSAALERYDILVIPQAYSSYSNDELSAIQDFVFNGGGLLVIGDDSPYIFTSLTGFAGITWEYGGMSGFTSDITPHPVTAGVSTIYLYAPVAYMYVSGDAQGLVRDSGHNIMLAVSEQPSGKVIGFADEDTLADYAIGQADNMRLALNMIDWLSIPVRTEHDLKASLTAPEFLEPNSSVLLNATVKNIGVNNETNVELQLLLDNELVVSEIVTALPSGSSHTLSYSWTPTLEGTYNITAYVVPVENETRLTNNFATRFITVAEPLIHPVEGQYANYTIREEDSSTGSKSEMRWNLTYAKYISPSEMNITLLQYQQNPSYPSTGWMIVNIFNRLVEDDSGIGWRGMWYPGWIETEVDVGSMVNLLGYNSTVTGSRPILVGNRLIDCWEIPLNFSGFAYEFWYDKASGLWVAMDASYGTQTVHLMLQDTNVPIGISYEHELTVTLDAPSLLMLGESATLGATVYNVGLNDETNVMISIIINDTTVDYATISTLHANENYTLSYLWTPIQAAHYNVTAYVPPVAGEQWTDNNALTSIVVCIYSQYIRTYAPPQWIGGGTAMNWHADDGCWSYTLPFDFPFYWVTYRTIFISSNGLITFNGPDSSLSNSIPGLAQKLAIAPAWDDWRTDASPTDDIYIWQPDSDHVVIRWQVSAFYDTSIFANFEVVLGSDGVIKFNYGENNGLISATAGISNGAGEILAEDVTDLNYINTILFTPFRPEHELAVSLEVPSVVVLGESVTLDATVYNLGLSSETEVELQLLIDGSLVDSVITPELLNGSSCRLSYLWTPTMAGSFNVSAYAPPLPNEASIENNLASEMVVTLVPPSVYYTVEPISIAPLTDVNASVYGLETPPSPSPVGQNFTVEIHLRNATSDNVANGVSGVEVHFDFSDILNYCTPVGFINMFGQVGGVLAGHSILYGISPGFYEDSTNQFPVTGPPYTNALFFNVAGASSSGPWNGADGVVASITFQITSQPPEGQSDFYAPLQIVWRPDYLVDSYGANVPFAVVLGTLQIDAAGQLSAVKAEVRVAPLNLKSHGGWSAGYIELPEGLNISDIDTSSLLLNGTVMVDPSAPVLTGDFDRDSALEVMVEFNRTQLANLIVSEGITFDNVTLMLTGQLFDGTQLAGTCQMNVSSLMGDINCDSKVSLQDLQLLANTYGSHPGDSTWNSNADFAAPWEIIGLTDLVTLAVYYGQHYP
jgi:thermitase